MADKPQEYRLSMIRSIAGRLFLWVILMLAIPCLVYLVIIGHQSNKLVATDVVAALHDVAEARADLFSNVATGMSANMQLIADWLPWYKITSPDSPLSHEAQDVFAATDISLDYMWIAYATAVGDRFQVVIASDDTHVGAFLDELFSTPVGKTPTTIALIDLTIGSKGQLMAQTTPTADGAGVAGVLVSIFELRYAMAAAAARPLLPYPLDVAVLDKDGAVVETSQLAWTSLRFTKGAVAPRGPITARLRPSPLYPNTYLFTWSGREWTAALAPIAGGQLQMIAVVEMDDALAPYRDLNYLTLVIGIVVVLTGAAAGIILSRRLIHPLINLAKQMQRVRTGDRRATYTPDPWGYELNDIGAGANRTLEALRKSTEEAANAEAKAAALQKEWTLAQQVQLRTLPGVIPNVPGLELAAVYKPAKEVAGDLYDLAIRDKPNNELLMAIADVCGKGIGACLHSLTIRGALRSAFYSSRELADMVTYANSLFYRDTAASSMFATLVAALYQPETSELHYTCCGHIPPVLIHSDGKVAHLATPGLVLGIMDPIKVEVGTIVLQEGDLIVMYSDGVSEAHDPDGHLFTDQRVLEVIQANLQGTPQQIVDAMMAALAEFQKTAEQHDDITLVVAKRVP
jgi:sigma-B regulation protein RsbU (phosphoserine phosphatase)